MRNHGNGSIIGASTGFIIITWDARADDKSKMSQNCRKSETLECGH